VSSEHNGNFLAPAAYVLESDHACHGCAHAAPVFAVMLVGPYLPSGDGLIDHDDAPLLTRIAELPEALARVLDTKSAGHFRLDYSGTVGELYYMNHCSKCGTKIGDWFIHEAGDAFFPTTDAEMQKVVGTRVDGPFEFGRDNLSVSSWTTEWLRRFPSNALD